MIQVGTQNQAKSSKLSSVKKSFITGPTTKQDVRLQLSKQICGLMQE